MEIHWDHALDIELFKLYKTGMKISHPGFVMLVMNYFCCSQCLIPYGANMGLRKAETN